MRTHIDFGHGHAFGFLHAHACASTCAPALAPAPTPAPAAANTQTPTLLLSQYYAERKELSEMIFLLNSVPREEKVEKKGFHEL